MSKIHAVITGMGGYVPQYVMTNEEISQMVDTTDEWIMTRIGIKERRILKPDEGVGVTYLAVKAIEDLMAKKPFNPLDIEAVIFATSTPDYIMPNSAAVTAYKAGMTNAFCFDLSAACSGFIYALEVGSAFIASGKYKKVMVIGGDVLSAVTNYEDRNTCPIFSDGCGAAILEPTSENIGVMDSVMKTDGNSVSFLHMLGGGSVYPASYETVDKKMHTIWQDGKVVFKHAVSNMSDACVEVMKRNNLSKEDIDWVVPHQANRRIIDAVANRMEVPQEKVMINIQHLGNTSAGTIPLCLWEWEPKLHKGDNIILTAFGAGFTWGAVYLKWGYDPK